MTRILRTLAAGLLLLAAATLPASARNLPLDAFFGTFKGTGVAENRDSLYFGVTVRDLDVTIKPTAAQGFAVEWSTVIRSGGDPANPDVQRKTQRVEFLPGKMAGVYVAADNGDPLSGQPYSWARVEGQSLITHLLTVGKDGAYEIQSYVRTLTPTGMAFTFRRTREGEEVRTVKGQLIKYAQ